MAPITFLVYEASCPHCGARHAVKMQTCIANWGAREWGARELRKGDRVPLEDLREAEFFEANPEYDGLLRILDDGMRCGDATLFTEVSLDASHTLVDLELVSCDIATLDRVHFLPPINRALWDWARSLPDPSDWNSDVLATEDRVRALRTKLMLREVLPARNVHEADLVIELIGCKRTGPIVPVEGTGHWRAPCDRIVLTFSLEDAGASGPEVVALPGGPSKILPADVFRRKADERAAQVPVFPDDLDGDRPLLAKARRDLEQASVYLEQLRTYIPSGEELVPFDAFWGDEPRADRESREGRYSRSRIEGTLARWRTELEELGRRKTRSVRSADEASVFMAIHPCPRCGTETPQLPSRIEADGDSLVSVYAGPCPECGLQRTFAFRLPDEALIQSEDSVVIGPGRSTCMDPGQFLIATDHFARRASVSTGVSAQYALQLAVASIDEILKFIPSTAGEVPEAAFSSRAGWAAYDHEPGRFSESRLRAAQGAYVEMSEG